MEASALGAQTHSRERAGRAEPSARTIERKQSGGVPFRPILLKNFNSDLPFEFFNRIGLKRKSSWSGFVRVSLLALADPNLQEISTVGSRWITSIPVDEVTAIVSPQSR